MDISDPISTAIPSLDGQILSVLARTTRPLTGLQIATLLSRGSYPGTRRVLARLTGVGLVDVVQAGASLLYTGNREHLLWSPIEALTLAADRFVNDLNERMVQLVEESLGRDLAETVSLGIFGSVARGTSDVSSDIDLVMVTNDELAPELAVEAVDALTAAVPRWSGNECNVYLLADAQIARLVADDDPMIREWQADVVTIHGVDVLSRIESARQ